MPEEGGFGGCFYGMLVLVRGSFKTVVTTDLSDWTTYLLAVGRCV